jgi:hypothetical protein
MIAAAAVSTGDTGGSLPPSNPFAAAVVALVLFGISYLIIRRTAATEKEPWLVKVLTAALILHLISSPIQIWVVDHFYNGIADWHRYTHQGALLAPNFRGGHFTLAGTNVRQIVGDGSVSVVTGVVFTIVGTNVVGAFFVFSWFAWLGTVFFYRAFAVTFPGASHRRYAYMLFFLPSLIFWTSDVSKESIMVLSVGVASLGAARVLAFKRNGYPLIALGTAMGAWVRPNELMLLFVGFVVAMLIRPRDPRQLLRGVRRVIGIAALAGLLILSLSLTFKYLHGSGGTFSLQQVAENNSSSNDKSGLNYSSNFATYPRDVYYVLFDPTPLNAHGTSQRIEAVENLILILLIIKSWRQLRLSIRVGLNRPYVILAGVYSVAFCYTFAALGNLGLITRERTILFPLFLVLLGVPLAPKGEPPYPWEHRRFLRKKKQETAGSARRGAPVRPPAAAPAPLVGRGRPVGGSG